MNTIDNYFPRSLIFISLSFSFLFSQVSFNAANISTSAAEAISVFAADMDGDGDMDIVSASVDDNTIAWHENDLEEMWMSDGKRSYGFTSSDIATTAEGAYSVFVADMDGDGDMDIVSASYADDTIAWYENDGAKNPTFTAADIATSAEGASSVFAADMDNDGDMDIVSASFGDHTIAWYENDGAANPSWTAADIATNATGAASVFAADMDGDGDMDIVSASDEDDTIAWYENDGAENPTFTAADIATSADGAASVYVADLDNDGDMDIVSASMDDNTIAEYQNNLAATDARSFTATDIVTSAMSAQSVFAADMDNDGDMDIVSASYYDDTIAWYENDGAANPSFSAADIVTSADGARSVFAADMDNDGDMDIVSASYNDDTIAWYENDGAANASFSAANIATSANGAASVFAADMDGDGDMDIVSASEYDDTIAWYENDGAADPTWSAANIATNANGAYSVFAADMDNDGDMDIVSASINDDTIAWYENDGSPNPTWSAVNIATNADGARSVFVADLDNDGDMDIVSASEYDDTIAWYENDGAANPSWTAVDIATSADGAKSVFAADMDNDGDMDILSASYEDDTIAWYENKGLAYVGAELSFSAANIATSADGVYADGPYSVFAADMDGEGDMDIVSASYWDNTIAWYENEINTNNAPVLISLSDVTINEDESSTVTLSATDADGDAITYSAVSDTNAVTPSISSSTLTLTPQANWNGVATITAYASDGSYKDSTSFKLTVNPVSDMVALEDVTIDEDGFNGVYLNSTFTGETEFTAVSDTNGVELSIDKDALGSRLYYRPIKNWHGVANIKVYASDGTSKDSTSFKLTVTSVNDVPQAFEWVSSELDSINIAKDNLSFTYDLDWTESVDVDGDTINYIVYAKIGEYRSEEIFDSTATNYSIPYEEIANGAFEGLPGNAATVYFSVWAHDGTDSVKISRDDRVLYVNRYDYLSIESEGVPNEFALHENYPNPFNPTTQIRFDLPEMSNVTLTIYNMIGQKIKSFTMQSAPAGYHSLTWNATNDLGAPVAAGVYLYQLQTEGFIKTKKMVLLK